MLRPLAPLAVSATLVAVLFAGAAMPDDAAIVAQPKKTTSLPSSDPRVEEAMTADTKALFGFTRADVEKADAEKLAKYLGPQLATAASAAALPGTDGSFGDYLIEAGDVLEFVSFDDETLNREQLIVRYDGYISLPRVSDIKVGGLTRPQAEEAIAASYSAIYREPEVSLAITLPASKTYTVTGDVDTPGRYPYSQATSLWDAISEAGGLRQRNSGSGFGGTVGITGQITKAFIIRRVDGERQVYPYDLRGLGKSGAYEGDTPVFYGDVVYVPEGVNLVYLLGESNAPVIVELTEGMTLLQMLALSGGFNTSTAKINSVILLREADEGKTDLFKINLRSILKAKEPDVVLQPGDVVYLPTKTLVRLQEFVDRSVGSLSQILGLYTQAIDARYALDLTRETLDALEGANDVVVPPRGTALQTPRVLPQR